MSTYHLEELEMGIAELPDGRLTNAVREQARWQPAQPVSFYCRYCHLQVYPSRRKQYVFFAHPLLMNIGTVRRYRQRSAI